MVLEWNDKSWTTNGDTPFIIMVGAIAKSSLQLSALASRLTIEESSSTLFRKYDPLWMGISALEPKIKGVDIRWW